MIDARHTLGRLILAASLPLLPACDSNPTEPGADPQLATVSAALHDSASVEKPGEVMPPADSLSYEGTVTGSARMELRSAGGEWLRLGGASDVGFMIFCTDAATVHDPTDVAAGTYEAVRLILTDFVATVDAGAVIGGTSYPEAFTVALGAGDSLVIEKDLSSLSLGDSGPTAIAVDLNTEIWLDSMAVADGVITASEVAAASQVFVR